MADNYTIHGTSEGQIVRGIGGGQDAVIEPFEVTEVKHKEINYTDPRVLHDPSIELEGIVRKFSDQKNFHAYDEDNISAANLFDATLIDGIEYPLVVINNRNIESNEIYYMRIDYDSFLPHIYIEIFDEHMIEQKLSTTQMSGIIRVCMVSSVDKVYKKILLNFRITDVKCDPNKPSDVTYYGEYYVEQFRQVNIGNIYMPEKCLSAPYCLQGGHVNANTWEMLHKISELTGLGFAATKNCRYIDDRIVRNIRNQRYDKFIEQQLEYSGVGEKDIFDAWVDLYGYIVMVNVKWVMDEEINAADLRITSNIGLHGTSNDVIEQKPETSERTITNFIFTGINSNIEISAYHTEVHNEAVQSGTLEHIYKVHIGGTKVNFSEMELQIKQDSLDGQYIEDYNTGMSNPIPVFNFNDPNYTGMAGGYNIDEQKKIRSAWFTKKRQSVLHVTLKTPHFGLQRGTLINVAIYELDPANKQVMFENGSNLVRTDGETQPDKYPLPDFANQPDTVLDHSIPLPNWKLTGLYYIDGMKWEYHMNGTIIQTLMLIKKGITTGYYNKHNAIRLKEN